MTNADTRRFHGIHAATVCPMDDAFAIDEAALVQHVKAVSQVPGIEGFLINGHAGENFVLTPEELKRVVELVRQSVGPNFWLTAGSTMNSSLGAARIAADAQEAGADALLVFPPNSWGLNHDGDMVEAHHRHVIAATTLPIVLYQAPVGAGRMAYSPATIARLIEQPRIAAIKEGSWEVATYEENWRLNQRRTGLTLPFSAPVTSTS